MKIQLKKDIDQGSWKFRWHVVYAWLPVFTWDGESLIWLEEVERKAWVRSDGSVGWTYRERKE